MSFHAYLLRCSDGSYYAGHTDDLERRVAQHQSGALGGYTASRRPVELVWSEYFPTREEALAAETRIKPWSRAKKEALIRGDWAALSLAARPPSERLPPPFVPSEVEGPDRAKPRSDEPGPRLRSARPSTALGTNGIGEDSFTPPPAIVLVRPQLGQNIGKAARAMLNFGLTDLRLVAPRDGWPNPEAGPAASGADQLLADARVYPDVAAAVADCGHVFATTVRRRGVTKPVVTPEQAARTIRAGPTRAAILFGPERSGLDTDDVAIARTILTVPINPAFGSLNLAQAVILVAYEWSKGEALAQPPAVDLGVPAPQGELDGMINQLNAMLGETGFFFPPDRVPTIRRTLRTMLTKPGWTAQEVRTMRGVLTSLARPYGRRD